MAHIMTPRLAKSLKYAIYIACFVLFIVVIVREHGTFADALRTMRTVSVWWVIAGFGGLLLSVLGSSGVYGALSPQPLRFWRTAAVQTGGLGINRLLPAGTGALGVAYLYLRANMVGKLQAATVVATNNLFGFVGHAILLLMAIVANPQVFDHFQSIDLGKFGAWLALAGGLAAIFAIAVVLIRSTKSSLPTTVRPLFKRPTRLLAALLFSMVITLCYAAAVIFAGAALGYHLSVAAALIVLSFGVAAASAVPIPGGIGAAEAGIFAGMHAYGATVQDALAVALLYRVMTFWLPLIVGGIFFVIVDRRGYIRVDSSQKRS
jgi:uncharacterized membrane protein YbhN (UPF0104 family)